MDGVNQWIYLSGQGDYISTDYVVHGIYGKEAYYQGNWKLVMTSNDSIELYNLQNDPMETTNIAADNKAIVTTMLHKLQTFPRGKSVHDPLWKTFMDMDYFGGGEDRAPYAGVEGVNAGPLHPIYYGVAILFLGIIGLVWYKRRNRISVA